jgi:hypothetical protein
MHPFTHRDHLLSCAAVAAVVGHVQQAAINKRATSDEDKVCSSGLSSLCVAADRDIIQGLCVSGVDEGLSSKHQFCVSLLGAPLRPPVHLAPQFNSACDMKYVN